jgi:uncharacterized membrane protein
VAPHHWLWRTHSPLDACLIKWIFNSFNRAGYSITETKEVLSSIASDCMVDEGDCLNAVEIFWCPSERNEVLNKLDVITDFPEILDL